MAVLGKEAIGEALTLFEQGKKPKAIPQDNDRATYSKKIDKSWGEIDWNMPAIELKNFVRGLTPWPGCFTFYDNERLKVWEVEVIGTREGVVAGEILLSNETDGLIVGCGDGSVRLKCIQGEGGRAMEDTVYLRGHYLPVGTRLGR